MYSFISVDGGIRRKPDMVKVAGSSPAPHEEKLGCSVAGTVRVETKL